MAQDSLGGQDDLVGGEVGRLAEVATPKVLLVRVPQPRDEIKLWGPVQIGHGLVDAALKGSTAVGDPAASWTVQLNAANGLVELLDTPAAPAHRAVVASMGGVEALLAVTDATLGVQPKTEIATGGSEEQISQLLVQLVTALGRLSIDNSHIQVRSPKLTVPGSHSSLHANRYRVFGRHRSLHTVASKRSRGRCRWAIIATAARS